MDPINEFPFIIRVCPYAGIYRAEIIDLEPPLVVDSGSPGAALIELGMKIERLKDPRTVKISLDLTLRDVPPRLKAIELLNICGRLTRTLYQFDGSEWIPLDDKHQLDLKGGESFATLAVAEKPNTGGTPEDANK